MGCGATRGLRRDVYDRKNGVAEEGSLRNDHSTLTQVLRVKSESSVVPGHSTLVDADRVLADILATKVSVEEFKSHLKSFVPANHPQATSLFNTLHCCVDLLAGGTGGVILAIVDKELVQDLQFSYLDNGLLMNLCRQVCPSVQQFAENFKAVLSRFCMHSETDRWSQHELEGLAAQLPEGLADFSSLLAPLEDNPKDGAFILSQSGTVVAAAGHLRYSSTVYQLVRADGHSCGTRHAAALALAEWLGTSNSLGAVFVRSDGGGVHAMLPSGGEKPPAVMHFDSLRDLSQEDMLKNFRATIMEKGKLMQKVKEAMIRKAVKGERVVTCVHGRVISEIDVPDDSSMVIQADTFSKELYVLPRAKFEKNWEPIGEETVESSNGFKRHRPKKGIMRWIYKITAADVQLCPSGCFKAAWGAAQPMREGDFLAMPAPEEKATEIYLMDADAVSCYAIAGGEEEPKAWHLSQQEMLSTFKDRIMRHGRLMQKVEPCMARQGRCGERVVTCVQGRVISDVTVQDDTSMVVRAPTIDQELYVLPQAKFRANWLAEPRELDKSDAVKKLLAVQGFKLYHPKPSLKWVYDVKAEDTKEVPTGCFYASWGALQPIQAGDFLAIPAPEDRANEVYLQPKEVVLGLQEVERDPAQAAGGPEPPTAPDAAQTPCSQEEMVKLFETRIRQEGRAVVKAKPAMVRPGRRGDHVVTYVNGRVISDTVIDDDTSMVVRAATVDQEEYVLTWEKFEANWELEGKALDEQDPVLAKLNERGFRLHRPKPNQKWVYRLNAEDLELVPALCFEASWGSVQPLRVGDFLALASSVEQGGRPEVYLMPADVVDSYTDASEAAKMVADTSSGSTIA